MSTIKSVKSSSDVNKQSTTEIVIQVFENFRENRPKGLEECVLTSLKLHRRYTSLPNMSLQSIFAVEAAQFTTTSMAQVFSDLRENRWP